MLDEFIQQYLRGQNIWLTVAHQSINQIDEQVQNSLFSLGTYMFGRAETMSEARLLVDVLFKADPYLVKHWRKVWGTEPIISPGGRYMGSVNTVIDHEPEFMPLEEQQERFAQTITEQVSFEFLLRPAIREGEVSQAVIPITIANLDRDTETGQYQYPNYERVSLLRGALAAQSGIPAASILKELDASLPVQRAERDGHVPHLREQQRKSDTAPDIQYQPTQRQHQSRRRIS
jgi:hypothetical protein